MIRKLLGVIVGIAALGWFIKPGHAALVGHIARQTGDALGALVTALIG